MRAVAKSFLGEERAESEGIRDAEKPQDRLRTNATSGKDGSIQ